MVTTEQSAANRSQLGVAMGNKGEVWLPPPVTEGEALEMAVKDILRAAKTLCMAADFAGEGEIVEHYVNASIKLRDMANALSPDRPEWPANVIPFVPRWREG